MKRKSSITLFIIFSLTVILPAFLLAATAPFIDYMESGVNGWIYTNDWGLGTPSGGGAPAFPTPPPLAHPSRSNCWGTNLNGKYTKNTTSRLTSPQIDVGSSANPFLSFYAWYAIAAGDYATFEVHTVGSPTWNILETINPGNSGGWVKKTYNLTGYTGNIEVRFTLSSDNDNATRDLGLYIDDVAVGINYTTQNRYVIAIEPELTPISIAGTSNNMTVRVEVRDLFKYIDNATNEVTIQTVQDGPNDSSLSQITPSPVYLSGGKATFTFRDTEKESVTFTPSVTGLSLNSISTTGRFLSPFRKLWKEKE